MTQQRDSRPGRPRRWVWGAIAAAVVVAALATWGILSGGPSAEPSASTTPAVRTSTPEPTTPVASPTPDAAATESGAAAPDSVIAPELPAVGLADEATGTDGVVVALEGIEAVDGVAEAPGEIAGPALRVTVRLVNDTSDELPLRFSAVNLYYGADRSPAATLMKPGGAPLAGTIAPGDSATGVYVFTVPVEQRREVTVAVDYRPGESTVVFRGDAG